MKKLANILLAISIVIINTPLAHAGVESSFFEAPKNIEAGTTVAVAIRANLSQDEHSSCYVKSTLSYSGNLRLKSAEPGNYPSPITFTQNLLTIHMTTGDCKAAGYTGSYTLATLNFDVLSEGKATLYSRAWKSDDIEVNGSVIRLAPIVMDIAPAKNTDAGPRFQGVTVNPYVGAVKLSWGTNVEATDVQLTYSPAGLDQPTEVKIVPGANKSYTAMLENLKASSSYNFTLTGTAADGTALRYDGYTTTKGYPVRIIVQQGESPIPDARVVIDDYAYKTDSEGVFAADIPPGESRVRVEIDGKTIHQTINVAAKPLKDKGVMVDRQDFTIIVPTDIALSQRSNWWVYALIGLGILALMAGGIIAWLWFQKRMQGPKLATSTPDPADFNQNQPEPTKPIAPNTLAPSAPSVDTPLPAPLESTDDDNQT